MTYTTRLQDRYDDAQKAIKLLREALVYSNDEDACDYIRYAIDELASIEPPSIGESIDESANAAWRGSR